MNKIDKFAWIKKEKADTNKILTNCWSEKQYIHAAYIEKILKEYHEKFDEFAKSS